MELKEFSDTLVVTQDPGSSKKDPSSDDSGAKEPVPVPVLQLFKYADAKDYILITVGSIFSIGYGIIQPVIALLLGDIIGAFIKYGKIVVPMDAGEIPFTPVTRALYDSTKREVQTEVLDKCVILSLVGVVAFFAGYLAQAGWLVAGERQARRVRKRFLSAILNQDVRFFDDNKTGDLTTRLSVDTLSYQEGISDKFGQTISYIACFIAGFVIAFIKGWALTLILLATVPLLGVSGFFVGKVFAEVAQGSSTTYGKAGAVAQETLANMRTVAAFGGQPRALKKFDQLLEEALRINEAKMWKSGAAFGVFFGLLYGIYALAFWSGSLFVVSGSMKGADILTVIFSIITGAFSLVGLGPSLQSINKARGSSAKLFAVIEGKPVISSDGSTGKTLETLTGAIKFDNVSFEYPSRAGVVVLKHFSLEVNPGQTVALVGFSGSGKSTTIQLLERYYDTTEGDIFFDNQSIKELNLKWLRSKIGLVSQEPILFDGTIAENIKYGADEPNAVTQEQIEAAAKMANAHTFITKLSHKYDTRVGEKGSLLSGGQKQRVAIARALIKNPQILLLDEATSALDTESEAIVQQALDRASESRTTIVIAHRLSTIKNADKIVVMSNGEIVEVGTHQELIAKNGHYTNLVNAQELKTKDSTLQLTDKPIVDKTAGTALTISIPDQVTEVAVKDDKESEEVSEEDKKKQFEAKVLKENKTPLMDVLRMQKGEYGYIVLGVVGSSAGGALLPIFGLIFGEVLNVFSRADPDDLKAGAAYWSLVFLGMMFLNFVACVMQFGGFGVAGERLTRRIRYTSFQAMLKQDMEFFDDPMNGTGSLTSRLSEDAEKIKMLTGITIGTIFQLLISLGVSLGAAFYYSWRMTLTVLAIMPMFVVGGYIQNKVQFAATAGKKVRQAYAGASQIACDSIANIRTVKSLNMESNIVERYMEQINIPYKLGIKSALITSLSYGFIQGLGYWIYAAAFYAGYRFVYDGVLLPKDLYIVLFSIVFGAISVGNATAYGINITKARVASIQYYQLINRVPKIDVEKQDGAKPVDVQGDLEFGDVKFSYPQRSEIPILKGISLDAKPGQMVALVGPSGSGKSTIVSLLERFYDPESGHVKVEGADVQDWNLSYLRSRMSIVSQEPTLFIGTIAENIAYGVPAASNEEIEAASKSANIHDFIKSLPQGYETEISNTQLSGGQKQRLCIARALLCKPKILLLDEATSALDSESEKLVQAALNAASQNQTTISIAHRLSTIQNADKIIVMKDGEIFEVGKHFELLEKKGLYHALVQRQQLGSQ